MWTKHKFFVIEAYLTILFQLHFFQPPRKLYIFVNHFSNPVWSNRVAFSQNEISLETGNSLCLMYATGYSKPKDRIDSVSMKRINILYTSK